jgi:taurine transport system permease protein
LLIWETITGFELISPLYLPSPQEVVAKLWDLSINGYMGASLFEHSASSLMRISIALLVAIFLGLPTGLAIGLNANARAIIDPLIEIYRPVPPLAYLPLIVIWFGIGEFSKVFLIFLAIFAPIVVATAAGVRKVDPLCVRVTQSLGGNRNQVIRYVIVPSILPDILTGIRIGLGAGWSTLVAAELIAATSGLGFMIQSASQFLMTDQVIAGILVIALIAFLLEVFLRYLQKKFAPWQSVRD